MGLKRDTFISWDTNSTLIKQLVSRQEQTKLVNEESRILRECRGRRLALLNRVFMTTETNRTNFYVGSEVIKDRYYYVEYKQNGNSFYYTCWDFASNRSDKCKHVLGVGFALHLGLVQQIDHKLPICQVKKNTNTIAEQYKNLSIATLNEMEKAEIEAEQYSKGQRVQRWEDDTYDF